MLRFAALLLALLGFIAPVTAHAACPEAVTSHLGVRDFTTTVQGSNNGKGLGVNGYYRMIVTERGCVLQATIIKLGFSGVYFAKEKRQSGTFPATVYTTKGPADRYAMVVDATLTSESGSSLSVGFTFVGAMGFWRYLGESWESVGFWGSLSSVPLDSASDDRFRAPEKPKCTGKVLRSGQQVVAGLFTCDEVAIVSADLRRILWFHPLQAYGAEGIDNYTKLAGTGLAGDKAYVAICTKRECDREGCGDGEKGIEYILTDGRTAASANPPDSLRSQCGIRTPPPARNDRWDGTIR